MANTITREFRSITLSFGAVSVGFMKRNDELMKLVQQPRRTLAETIQTMPFIHESARAMKILDLPGGVSLEDFIDDRLGADEISAALLAALEASGFTYASAPSAGTGDTPGEPVPA